MSLIQNVLESDFTLLIVLSFCLYNIVLAVWGLSIMNNSCTDQSLFTQLRLCLVSSAVMSTFLMAVGMCNYACKKDDDEIHWTTFLLILIWSILSLTSGFYISKNISNCTSNDVGVYQDCWLIGKVLSGFTLLATVIYFFVLIKNRKDRKALETQKKYAKSAAKAKKTDLEQAKARLDAEKEALADAQKRAAEDARLLDLENKAKLVAEQKKATEREAAEKMLVQQKLAKEEAEKLRQPPSKKEVLAERLKQVQEQSQKRKLEKSLTTNERKLEELEARIEDPRVPEDQRNKALEEAAKLAEIIERQQRGEPAGAIEQDLNRRRREMLEERRQLRGLLNSD